MIRILKFLLIIILLFAFNQLRGQKLKFFYYSQEDGLSAGRVFKIIQDKNGFLWFGTAYGLNKFDGYNFTVFINDAENKNSISDNNVYDILEDKEGILWLATRNGLNSYDQKFNIFHNYTYKKDSNSISDDIVICLLQDKDGLIWIGTEFGGLNSFNKTTQEFYNYDSIFNNDINEGTSYIRCLFEDKQGNIWIGTDDAGIFCYDKKQNKFINYKYDLGKDEDWIIRNNRINVLFEDSHNNLWIGTWDAGINLFNKETSKFIDYGKKYTKEKDKQKDRIFSIIEDKYGKLWVATYNGLTFYNRNTKSFSTYYTVDEKKQYSIKSNRLRCLLEDASGSIWIGNEVNGVNVVHNTQTKFFHYHKDEEDPNSLNGNIVLTFEKEEYGNILIGTVTGGLNLFDRKKKIFKNYNKYSPELRNGILSIHLDNDGIIWLGTWGGGLQKFNRKTSEVATYSKENFKSLSYKTVLCIYEDKNDILWLGTYNGLNKFDKNKEISKVYDEKNGLKSKVIFHITGNDSDTIWLGTKDGGFSIFNKKTETFQNFLCDKNDSLSICNNVVHYIHDDNKGNLWMGTEGGLNKFNKKTQTFTTYTEKDGLPNNTIYAILEDKKGNLWLSSIKGICRFNPNIPITDRQAIRNFDVNDGLQGNEFTQGGYFYDKKNDEMFFGGINGFNSFFPDKITENNYIPPVHITSFKIFDKEQELDTSIIYKKGIEISWKQNFIAFDFVGLDFVVPSKNLYSYKMEGLDVNWSPPSNRRYAPYPGISPGEYTFKVRASNNEGLWNEQGREFLIIVKPPFWKTTWFLILSIITGITSVLLYIRTRTERLKKEKRILEEIVAQRTKELREKNQDITSSIEYAKRIQEAILPKAVEFDKAFTDTFVLYKPKDIVSGDFFWFTKKNNKRIFAAADCTGHGVPGAFMSIIGNDLLEKIISEENILDPGEILNRLNICVKEALHQTGQKGESFDGMDIALCSLEDNSDILEYSGAYRPIFIISEGKITKYKPDKYSIGGAVVKQEKIFKTQKIKINNSDKIYAFSDGFVDQFGGPYNRKFMLKFLAKKLLEIEKLSMIEQEMILDETIEYWMKGFENNHEQIDDILIIGIEI